MLTTWRPDRRRRPCRVTDAVSSDLWVVLRCKLMTGGVRGSWDDVIIVGGQH